MSYFVGKPTQFDVELPVNIGTDFQRSIWAALGDIPYGEYETYGEFALRLGHESNPGHWQCCGTESVANPLSLPPDRRLHGCPTGYPAGPRWKAALQQLEGVAVDDDRVKIKPPSA